MESFQLWEAFYFAGLLIGGGFGGAFRTLYNGSHKSIKHTLVVGVFSGLLAFACVAIFSGSHRQPNFNPVFYLGVAVIIGLAGPEQTQIITRMWTLILGRINAEAGQDN